MLQQIIFIAVLAVVGYIVWKKARQIYQSISMGKPENRTDQPEQRLKNMLLLAFGQKKMFRNLTPAFLHLCVYVAFVITQIELIEIITDGVFGVHRFFRPFLGGFYTFIISFIEVLSVLALVATLAFLSRRNLLRLPRFTMKELAGWPMKDANLILIGEIVLITGIFSMNTADMQLHQGEYGFLVSGMLMPLLSGFSETSLHVIERFGWWLHILTVFGFLLYLPYSKHLHIVLAFPNAYFADLSNTKGKMTNMPRITQEINLMLNPSAATDAPPPAENERFGAKDIQDLSWKSLLDAYACTECGRCTAACPANITGKMLSPRKIMMATRDRMEDIAKAKEQNGPDFDDGKTLLHDYITPEELRACTTCNACVEECPVSISPLNIILELRRCLILEESNSPDEWNKMFNGVESNGAVWQLPAEQRLTWIQELEQK
ncbi:MAG TPA: 4Fe-4S dicluster domain-containing protein [Chitinophagales bacterium]|nr:4Fe-4S dicluster domain-containing protein [Chitinophagales bacterium]HRK26638.1 4Fe-4S dicluster domain-containing protein [Chitinophagales bacterium]